jgi:hypothetical protein
LPKQHQYASECQARPDAISWAPAVFKDLRYRVEREIRLIATVGPELDCTPDNGIKPPVDATPLALSVILHPHATPSFRRLVALLVGRHVPSLVVKASQITSRLY